MLHLQAKHSHIYRVNYPVRQAFNIADDLRSHHAYVGCDPSGGSVQSASSVEDLLPLSELTITALSNSTDS
jgi:hypothetical protein